MDAVVQYTMCRVCTRSDSKIMLIGLFEHHVQTQSLAKVISLVGAVEVQQDDELPNMCCSQCLREVEAAYKLRILCQESDVKLRSRLANKATAVTKEPLCNEELNLQYSRRVTNSYEVLLQKELEKLQSMNHIPGKHAPVKKESFSYGELNALDPEELTSSDEFLAQKEVGTPETLKHEYEEITIEETRIIDDTYSESNQCSEIEASVSENINGNYSNNQELETNVSENTRLRAKLPNIFDKYPAVKFSCCGCISSFDTIKELRVHGREKHWDKDFEGFTLKERQCDICFEVLINGQIYDFHKENVMFNYRCQICEEIVITTKQACAHYRLKHAHRIPTADEALICCGCKMRFRSAEALRNHSEMIHLPKQPPVDKKKPVTCNICYHSYSTKGMLRWHKLGYLERTKDYPCKKCGKSFHSRAEARHHEKSHIHLNTSRRSDIRTRSNTHTQKTFLCSQCPRVYPSFDSLKDHFYSHHQPSKKYRFNVEDRPYQCEECKKSFKTKTVFDQHTQVHSTTRPFSCPHCPKTFKLKGHLKTHVATHNSKKKYPCPQCARRFKSKSGIYGHIKKCHDKAKPLVSFVCPFCLKGFTTKYIQIRHVKKEHPEQTAENPDETMLIIIK